MYTAEPYLTFSNSTATTKSFYNPYRISETEKYLVAQVARQKLLVESSFRDHDLRRLVGHANLVDLYLAEHAPQEQQKYALTHVESIEKKPCGEVKHVSEYIVQQRGSNSGTWENGKQTYASLTVSSSNEGSCRNSTGTENNSVHVTLDYAEVEIDEVEVSEDDD